jgi:hypothetical protein
MILDKLRSRYKQIIILFNNITIYRLSYHSPFSYVSTVLNIVVGLCVLACGTCGKLLSCLWREISELSLGVLCVSNGAVLSKCSQAVLTVGMRVQY